MLSKIIKSTFLILPLLLVLFACEQSNKDALTKSNEQASANHLVKMPTKLKSVNRNWQEIKKEGVIRALKLEWEEESALPRSGASSLYHLELFNQFALQNKLTIEWVKVKSLGQMFDYLVDHKADIIPRHLTITDKRKTQMLFTQALLKDEEVLIAKINKAVEGSDEKKQSDNNLSRLAINEITVSVPEDTAYIESIKMHYPKWKIDHLSADLNTEKIADALLDDSIKYSILDGRSAKILLNYYEQLEVVMKLPRQSELAWAVAKNNETLLDKVNEFIAVHHVQQNSENNRLADLDIIKEEKLPLRIITRNSPETYFLWRGELVGFEYELMQAFAKKNKVRLEVIVAQNYQEMIELLEQGQGDLIAAGLSKTDSRLEEVSKSKFAFSKRYNRISEKLVSHIDSQNISSLDDLKGRSITVRKSSAFWSTAKGLAEKHQVNLIAADENISTELLIGQVADKQIDLTIADSNLIDIEKKFRSNIITPLTLNKNIPYGYLVRKQNPNLLKAVNRFIKKEYRQTFYNVVKNKYFSGTTRQKNYRDKRIVEGSNLSPYDQLVKAHAREYQFDWRLITSQMYQESRFDPKALSAAGAQGLMQVLPRTGKELGFTDLHNPVEAIAAGVQYMNWSRDRFSKDLPVQEQVYFSLAAYNAGYGHVKDAQRLAKSKGWRSDKWFNHVEKAMLLLQRPQYYKKARFGYCRGSEPVNYVRNINQRYLSYIDITR